jgi:hypothetical protein
MRSSNVAPMRIFPHPESSLPFISKPDDRNVRYGTELLQYQNDRTLILGQELLTLVLSGYKVTSTVIEHRKNRRFALRLPLEIVRHGVETHKKGETRNMSSSGVLFTSNDPVAVGEPIEYLITFPRIPGSRSEVRLRCVGKVLRNYPAESEFAATLERYEFVRK